MRWMRLKIIFEYQSRFLKDLIGDENALDPSALT